MECRVKNFAGKEMRDVGSSHGCHFFGAYFCRIHIDKGGQEGWDAVPVLADAESELFYSSVQPVKARYILIVVQGSPGDGQTLVGDCILESFHLCCLFKIQTFDLFVFCC